MRNGDWFPPVFVSHYRKWPFMTNCLLDTHPDSPTLKVNQFRAGQDKVHGKCHCPVIIWHWFPGFCLTTRNGYLMRNKWVTAFAGRLAPPWIRKKMLLNQSRPSLTIRPLSVQQNQFARILLRNRIITAKLVPTLSLIKLDQLGRVTGSCPIEICSFFLFYSTSPSFNWTCLTRLMK